MNRSIEKALWYRKLNLVLTTIIAIAYLAGYGMVMCGTMTGLVESIILAATAMIIIGCWGKSFYLFKEVQKSNKAALEE